MFYVIIVFVCVGAVNGLTAFLDAFPNIPNTIQHGSNEICKRESKLYEENLKNHTLWAYQMFDSSAKSTIGVLHGNTVQLGRYEECLAVTGPFPTQHCIITMNLYVPHSNKIYNYPTDPFSSVLLTFQKPQLGRTRTRLGLCLPASCSVLDIEDSLTEYLKTVENENLSYNITTIEDHMCTNNLKPNEFGALQIIFCIFFAYLVVFLLVVTIIDFKTMEKKEDFSRFSKAKQILFSFSARRTWKILFSPKKAYDELGIFHGIKTIAQLFIVFGHIGYVATSISWVENKAIEDFAENNILYFYSQLTLILDIFFLISGLMLSYGTLKKMKDRHINPIVLIVLRYCRLTPVNAIVIFYFVAMLGFSGSGPAWNLITQPSIDGCFKNWWTNILYVNNFLISNEGWCNRVTWYLSADFQLFIVGAVIMYVIGRNQRVGYGVLIFLLILSILPPFILTYIYDFAMIAIHNNGGEEYTTLYYLKPYTYATTYFIGLMGGIMYHRFSSQKVKIPKRQSYILLGVSFLLMILSYGYPIFFNNEHENYMFESALYNAVYRQLWTIGLLGTFTIASFGTNTFWGSFLSSGFWIPFSKLTYGLYLVQWAVLLVNFGNSVDVLRPSPFNMASLFISVTVISFAVSFVIYFLIEMPIIKVISILLTSNNKSTKKLSGSNAKLNGENHSLS